MGRILQVAALLTAIATAACGRPDLAGLRESFAQQVAANRFVKDFQRDGDDLTFSGPGAEGGVAKWRIHIDSAAIDSNDDDAMPYKPYKGTVKSSWYSDGQRIEPSGGESNLPFELLSNGLSQDCWALWDKTAQRWSWE